MSATQTLEVDLEGFAAQHPDVHLIDVREPDEYVAGHVPGAIPMPLSRLGELASDLPRDRTVYVICASGNRSLRAATALTQAGFTTVSVAGGTLAWSRSGRGLVPGDSPT
jgi:rhodanese-related sulfurtransferase